MAMMEGSKRKRRKRKRRRRRRRRRIESGYSRRKMKRWRKLKKKDMKGKLSSGEFRKNNGNASLAFTSELYQ